MPKVARELTPIQVRRLTDPGHYPVGGVGGLLLQVSKSGARSWILRTMIGGRRRDIGLGGFGDVTLKMARERAREMKDQIRRGIDPIAERKAARSAVMAQQAKAITFRQCAAQVIAKKQAESSNKKHAAQWESTLETYAYPVLGNLAVSDIELAHILDVLRPNWQTKTETMTRVRQRIETVMSWATVHGHRSGENPARWRGHLDTILPAPAKIAKVKHHAALPVDGIYDFVANLREQNGIGARALEFAILTAARSGEVRGACWSEIDMNARLWTIPADRMKAGREHRVPLSKRAVKLLETLPRHDGNDLVFVAPRGGQLSDAAMGNVLKRMDVKATTHGFRSTFRDWTAERTSTPHHVAEMALAHTIKNEAEAAYRRGDLLAKREKLMQQWADFIDSKPATGNVSPIRGERYLPKRCHESHEVMLGGQMSDRHIYLVDRCYVDEVLSEAFVDAPGEKEIDWTAEDIVSELRDAWRQMRETDSSAAMRQAVEIKINVFNPAPFLIGRGTSLADYHAALVKEAKVDSVAFEAAKALSKSWLRAGVKLTPALSAFAAELDTAKRPRKSSSLSTTEKNRTIALWLDLLNKKTAMPMDLNDMHEGPTCSKVLAEVFHISIPTVKKAWQQEKDFWSTLPD